MLKLSKVLTLVIIDVQVEAVKIYVEGIKERQDEPQFTTKIDGFLSSSLPP
jgi:hypothetical protein